MLITHLCLVATILNGEDIKITIITEISLVAQTLKRLPAMRETWVQSLGQEIPWRRKWQPTPVFLPGESHGQRSLVGYSPWGFKRAGQME